MASYWPGNTKGRMTPPPPHPPNESTTEFPKAYLAVWGSGKYAQQLYESIGPDFDLFGHGKSLKTRENDFLNLQHFELFSDVFGLSPEILDIISENQKLNAPYTNRASSFQQNVWCHRIPFGDKSDH